MESESNAMPNVLFREIHKNGCLKKYGSEKRTGFPRKTERVWAVFCVHDDTEAFLEFYPDHKVALGHKPEWFVSLHNALHVSPSICGQSDEFEFAVTLPSQVVRLAAASWDTMMEWVDTIRNKLRELRVLAPKENHYSKMPEPRHALLPTRDPTSPLPLPPVGGLGTVPGIESPIRAAAAAAGSQPLANLSNLEISSINEEAEGSSQRRNGHSDEPTRSEAAITTRQPSQRHQPAVSSSSRTNSHESGSSVVVVSDEPSSSFISQQVEEFPPTAATAAASTDSSVASSGSNITVIEVPPPQSPHYEHLFIADDAVIGSAEARSKLERVSSSGMIPRVPSSRATRDVESRPLNLLDSPARVRDRPPMQSPPESDSETAARASAVDHTSVVRVKSSSNKDNSPKQTSVVRVVPSPNSISVVTVVEPPPSSTKSVLVNTSIISAISHEAVAPIAAAFQPAAPSGLDVKDIPLIGGHQRRRRRSSSSDAGPSQRGLGGADLIRLAPAEAPEVPVDAPRLTLRETQVCQLRREMAHPGGVRLPLRRKDCFGAIALVDISNTVWVAGWKQREHPMLYNALHIGDQLVSVGDIPVRSSNEAQKLLKGPAGPTVELVVRRLPLGKVLTLQRPRGGGDVGLLPDTSNVGEVSVVPGGAAARAGLTSRTTTMDGLGLTLWTLTEINGRPLNLFCKAADVATRLNSVGKELSVLVQPSDFIKQLRKQMKNLKGYKDYLLQ